MNNEYEKKQSELSYKKKKKSKHSHKKPKKEKYSSSSSSSEEEQWVEKKVEQNKSHKDSPPVHEPVKRDDWMLTESAFKTYTRDELRRKEGTSRVYQKQEERRKQQEGAELGSHPLELNPFYKSGGKGLPSEASSTSTYDAAWLKKALARAKEQAREEGKTLEEIASKRWGSLEKFNELLAAAEKSPSMWKSEEKPRYERRSHRGRDRHYKRSPIRSRRDRSRSPKKLEPSRMDIDDKPLDRYKKSSLPSKRDRSRSPQKSEPSKMDTDQKPFYPKMDYRHMSRKSIEKMHVPRAKSPIPMEDRPQQDIAEKPTVLNDHELNRLGAKLTKAELLGNEGLAAKLKSKLEAARAARKEAEAAGLVDATGTSKTTEEVVVLSRTLDSGYTVPMATDNMDRKIKKKKISKALIEFQDRYNIKEMFATEKGTSSAEHVEMAEMAALKMGPVDDDYCDQDAASLDLLQRETIAMNQKQQNRAAKEFRANERVLESCDKCFANKEMKKHLIVSLGSKCYLSIPSGGVLAEGQCCIIPIHHVQSCLLADEDLWQEITVFRKALIRMFASKGQQCVFFESFIQNKYAIPHMILNCVPMENEVGDLAPIYFKKAIDECEMEWAQNKKLVNLKDRGGVRRALPKGLSYFFVDFGMDPGYGHVIEDEKTFPKTFAQEILGGMVDADPFILKRPPKLSFDSERENALKFSKEFKPFDPTLEN